MSPIPNKDQNSNVKIVEIGEKKGNFSREPQVPSSTQLDSILGGNDNSGNSENNNNQGSND